MTLGRGRREATESLSLSLASGIALGLPFAFPGLWLLHYFALVPWVLLVSRREARHTSLFLWPGAYVFGVIVWILVSSAGSPIPFFISIFFSPWYMLFGPLVRRPYLRWGVPLSILVPAAWVTVEFIRVQYSVGSVPLYPLGATQFRNISLIQIADTTGMAGVSFVVAAASGALCDVWRERKHGVRRWLWPLPAYGIVLLALFAYGRHQLRDPSFVKGPRIAITQPNLKHYRDSVRWKTVVDDHIEFTRLEVPADTADLIVWPENAVGRPISDDSVYIDRLRQLAREKRSEFIFGGYSWAGKEPFMHSSAYHLSETGNLLGLYHKIYLIPWSERLAFDDWLPRISPRAQNAHRAFARSMTGMIPVGIPGPEVVVFVTETEKKRFRFAVPICFEITSSEFARRAVSRGAQFLLNITSEGELGEPLYTHTWAMATYRAVENRIGVVRNGNTGISGFIDPDGRTQSLVRGKKTGALFLEAGTLIDQVSIDRGRLGTFYTRHGEWFVYLCGASVALLFVLSFLFPRRRDNASSADGRSSRP